MGEPVKILFFGDSLTYYGTSWRGAYIRLIESYAREEKKDQVKFMASGVSGNKVTDLYARVDRDVLSRSPDIVVIFIGVNDIWHELEFGMGTGFTVFQETYTALVQKLQSSGIVLVMCTPTCIGEQKDFANEGDNNLNRYSQWIRDFAHAKDIPVVDLRKAFVRYQQKHNHENVYEGVLTKDGVHLSPEGSQLVAKEMWKVLKTVL